MFFNRKRLALHIEENKLHIIIYALVKGSYQIEKTQTINYDRQELLDFVGQNQLQKAKVQIVLGGKDVITRSITIPSMPTEEIIKTLRWEIIKYIPLNLEDLIYDYQIVNKDNNQKQEIIQILLVAIKKHIIEQHCDFIANVGLVPYIVDTEGTIFKYIFKYLKSKKEKNACLIFLNNQRGIFSFIVNKKVFFVHNFEIKTEMTKEIVNEYEGVLTFLKNQFNLEDIHRIYLFGNQANDHICDLFEKELKLHISRGELSIDKRIILPNVEESKGLPLFSLGLLLRGS
ncbi:hypothetical protein SAMN00017405_0265 [Desulfonispora thiosulfatigenes DSM 11270]|uniref:Type IV pilus assembly protein PilM n=1 Tax=Desulfonispora thiosulfatigenes DSM 11270 TaxID=656914 RepID=A0A1W1VN00_DESTI|nr:pilus assembly protein PilM [Desulfonispora thiosulfatigenes]SMB94742.1 hypothetical protein SAMN00017405_0265 [Desulfonispora thiosulfatigenes DSM 11270]